NYQRGAIHWTTATGAHATLGAIRSTWAGTGYERGRLGYPTGPETCANNRCTQTFQGGTLTWTPTTGTRITYK
ncbi:LGFP repeat-containing protein, partial [Arthrobacter sp. Ld5]|uniref:LGFP repeat-containing protein n=2 Tax=Arthrobacter sp. Ld5 TaxID=649152 RepID=UPI003EBE0C0C